MIVQFVCTDCGCAHREPADALLGFLVLCLDCAMHRDFHDAALGSALALEPDLAA